MIARAQLAADLEAERARSALLAASLKQAEAEVGTLAQALKAARDFIRGNALHQSQAYEDVCAALTAVGVV